MNRGGIESYMMNYYRHFDHKIIQIDFVVHNAGGYGYYDEEIKNLGGQIFTLPQKSKHPLSYTTLLKTILKKGNYKIIHTHMDAMGAGELPLQIANLGATIANRGHFITPHIVKEIEDNELDSIYRNPRYPTIDREYYEMVVKGMRAAVDGSTGSATCRMAGAILPGVEVCGKTGTAQNRGKDHSVFMGFAPMDNPKIATGGISDGVSGYGCRVLFPLFPHPEDQPVHFLHIALLYGTCASFTLIEPDQAFQVIKVTVFHVMTSFVGTIRPGGQPCHRISVRSPSRF